MQARLYFLHALSPLHVGTGQGVDVIDLPTAREKVTGFPYAPGSGVRGVLRDVLRTKDYDEGKAIPEQASKEARLYAAAFGPGRGDRAAEAAGALLVGDARLACLPVRSLRGTFAWVTCPMVLRRLARDAREAGAQAPDLPAMSDQRVAAAEAQGTPSAVAAGGHVLLEDLKLTVEPTSANLAYGWADWLGKRVFPGAPGWQVALARRFLVVTDDVFSYLAQTGTQVDARVRLDDDTKTVARGALWYEESLPAESILAGLVAAEPVTRGRDSYDEGKFLDLIATRTGKTMQLGGKAGVGRGLVRFVCAAEQGKKP